MVPLLAGLWTIQAVFCAQAAPDGDGAFTAAEEAAGVALEHAWDYRPQTNTWFYYDGSQKPVTGRRFIDGNTYFFDEDGRMLTGWVTAGDRQGDAADPYEGGSPDDDVYYCTTSGAMAVNRWVQSYAPDVSEPEYGEEGNWYYFDGSGHACRNRKVAYEGNEYIFDGECVRVKGWVYEGSEKNGLAVKTYVAVDEDTAEAQSGDLNGDGSYSERFFAHNPQYYLYCENDSGRVVKNAWVDALPPGKGEGEDVRSFYLDKNGRLVTQYRYGSVREEADWNHYAEDLNPLIVTDRIWPRKIEEEQVGTYRYNGAPGSDKEDEGFEGFIMKAEDGRYYLCENNGARLDGLFLIRKKEESSLRKFPNGIYDFSDHAAMVTGRVTKENPDSKEVYSYYFAEDSRRYEAKGRGVTGVYGGKLYYQGLAVGAGGEEPYELVYIPEIADRSPEATGLFLVDGEGNVKKGSRQKQSKNGAVTGGTKYKMDNGYTYRVCSPSQGKEEYGYDIYKINRDLEIDQDPGVRLGAEDASYIYLGEAEE